MYRPTLNNILFLMSMLLLITSDVFAQANVLETKINAFQQSGATFYDASSVFSALPALKAPKDALERNTQRLKLNQTALAEVMSRRPDYLTMQIPYNDQIVTVDLYEQNILSPDFNVRTGDWQKTDYSPGVYYRGIIRGVAGSLVAFSFFDTEMMGILSHREWGNLNLGRKETIGNETEYLFFAESLLPPQPFNDCVERSPDHSTTKLDPTNAPEVAGCVQQFFEADYALYLNKGSSVQSTVNYVSGFFNAVATIYNIETVSIALSQVYVWTTQDPYDYSSSGNALDDFQLLRTNFTGDLAHLVSLGGTGLGGIAYLDVLCSNSNNYAFSGINSSYSYPAYSWTVNVVAHEMGHNFASRHTHWCGWAGGAIDNCGPTAGYPFEGSCTTAPTPTGGGTIMSYCHLVGGVGVNFANNFGPLPGNAIRNAVTGASGCIAATCPTSTCAPPSWITVSSITTTTASVSWNTIAGATGYNLQYRLSPSGAWTTISNTTSPRVLTGLLVSTKYEVQVQTICSGGVLSPYYVGNIFKTQTSPCPEPSALLANPITNTSVSLDWTENGAATTWEIQWGLNGFALGSGTIVAVNTKPYTLSGLATGTAYAYYVRSTCGGAAGNSTWVGPFAFSTPFANDLSSGAVQLIVNAACPASNFYTNNGSGISAGEFSPTTSNGGEWFTGISNTVWFWFNAPASGTVNITTDFAPQGSNDDVQIAVYNNQNPTNVNQLLTSAEDGGVNGNGYNPNIYYTGLTAGTPYYIQVDGYGVTTGSFCIEVHETITLPSPGSCTAYTQASCNGATAPTKWFNIYTRPVTADLGIPVAAVKSSVNLGTVTVREILNPSVLAAPNGVRYMQRYYAITSSQNTSAARDIRLFYTDTEFGNLKSAAGLPSAVPEDLNISRFTAGTADCSIANNTGTSVLNTNVTATSVGSSGIFYLQFNSVPNEFAAVLGNTPLPIELSDFSGLMERSGNILHWTTLSERNLLKYAIERSDNGINNWKSIGEQLPTSSSNGEKKYQITDAAPFLTTYYRLVIFSTDGTVEYSNIITLEREITDGIKRIAPNPAQNEIYVTYNATREATVIFKVIGYDGRLVMQQPIELNNGTNILPFDISDLPSGVYYCIPNEGKGLPFVKQ